MLGPVSVSIPTLVVELVIFLATVWLMEQLVFEPVRRARVERERAIQDGLSASSESESEAKRGADQVREVYADARRRAQTEVDTATTEGNRIRDELLAQATQEFRSLLDDARNQIAREREESASVLRQRIVDLALLAAGRVTGQQYDEPHVRELAATVVEREGLR